MTCGGPAAAAVSGPHRPVWVAAAARNRMARGAAAAVVTARGGRAATVAY